MITRFITLSATLLALATLSACGIVAAFIPDQEVVNPLGIDGQVMESTLQATEPDDINFGGGAALHGSDVSTAAAGTMYANFGLTKEVKNAEDTLPINPNGLVQPLSSERLIISKATDDGIDFPDTIELRMEYVQIGFWDDLSVEVGNWDDFVTNISAINQSLLGSSRIFKNVNSVPLTLVKDDTACNTRRCAYVASVTATLGSLELGSSDVKTMIDILKPGTNSNTIGTLFAASFTSDPELPDGGSVQFVLGAETATVTF